MTHDPRRPAHPLSASSHSGSPRPGTSSAAPASFGELHPVGGGDPIPLLKETLVIGRRESSDIVLRFPNVSGTHCELSLVDGQWVVRDLDSSNGTKVNGTRVMEGRLDPGDRLSIGRHEYEVCYVPGAAGVGHGAGLGGPIRDIFSRSLLATAGLENRRGPNASVRPRS